MSLLNYEELFANLRMNTSGSAGDSRKSPHKVAMLLAVIDLITAGVILQNKIYFDQSLKDAFANRFKEFATEKDRNNPQLPFFHLRSSGFFHHHIKPGKAASYANLTTASSIGDINENIAYAYIDDELFELLSNLAVRELLKSALYKSLSPQDRNAILDLGKGWNWLECECTVNDYFAMLNQEIRGERYNKTEHRRNLRAKLNERSEAAIEFKHQNISAILLEMGQPYIAGYKPAFNYQHQLKQVVLAYMAGHSFELDRILETAQQPINLPVDSSIDWLRVLDQELPERIPRVAEPQRDYLARKTNYADCEMRNRSLGEAGEKFAIDFERYRLEQAGRTDLAKEIVWASKEEGDGLGFDIRSFNPERDEELFIEVKTTSSGKYQPFYITDNEVAFSKDRAPNYCLYRVYDFRREARLFMLHGAIEQHVNLAPKNFKAEFING
ncbi:MAG TPA: DUF3883 domain-containing protein [Spongiibacteraceae bacterium]|nr:DUF3883 domain-containing protein [Spongiibacteraceae bacterium]